MESKNKFEMCRLCLCENECFVNIFEVNDCKGYVAAEIISDLLRFQVSEADGYPHFVCTACLTKLTDFRLFKECCQKAKVMYDKMFASHGNLVDHKPEMPIIKEEELIIDSSGDLYDETFEDTNTETSFGPIPLKNEFLSFNRDSYAQDRLIESEAFGNGDAVEPVTTSIDDSTQEDGHDGSGVELCDEDPLKASSSQESGHDGGDLELGEQGSLKDFSSDVEVPLAETFTHPKYLHFLEKTTPHITFKGEIEEDSCTSSISTSDELVFEKTKNISLSEEFEASSSGTMERLEYKRILPGESMDMAPHFQQKKERVRMEQDTRGDGGSGGGTSRENGERKRREGLECFHCGIVLMSKLALVRHMKVHEFLNSYDCPECGKVFHFSCQLKMHLLTHTGSKPHKCAGCSKCFTQSSSLKRHMRLHTGSKPYKCADCSKCFSQNGHLKTHMKIHTGSKPYKCEVCSKCFSDNGVLKRHKRLHTGSKPYKCAVCSKCFSQNGHLKRHMRLHTGSKPYKCEECSKCFSDNGILKSHMRLHTGSKPYKCAGCSKCFREKGNLRKHMRVHTGSKPYKCEECSKCFSNCSNLKRHTRLHTGSKPYKCAECSKCFSEKGNLRKHMRVHTGSKPYK